ncbi:MAG: pitrilysin family protein [bacterium]
MNLDPYRNETPPRREILDSGAVLLTQPMANAHSVALGFWLRSGTQDEPSHLGGISHFLEHIVFKGSETHSAFELARTFDSLGVALDAFTTKEHVAFTVKVLPEYLEPALAALADMLLRPALDDELITLEQDVVCEEIQEARDTPEDHLHDAFAARIYGAHPRGRPILGSQDSVHGFDAEILRREHRRFFVGPNVVIGLAGHVTSATRDIVLRHFDLPGAPDSPTDAAVVTDTPTAATGVEAAAETETSSRLELPGAIVQSYFEMGNLAVSYRHPDRIPLYILSNLLGGGMSSRIFQAVREREGLAYTIYTYNDMGRDIGLVSCAGSCSPAKTARLEQVVLAEYERVTRDGVSSEELANNCAQIKSQLIFSLEGVTNQMFRVAKNELYFGRFIPVAELVDEIDAVDQNDIVRCAREYYVPEQVFVAIHGP